ncbi:hypothetical protein B0H19DRAFT_174428 [Mycena capillaripes]|nr:hypothetical protein B0H19DRAFT_174428 [Mycena capillaripes]
MLFIWWTTIASCCRCFSWFPPSTASDCRMPSCTFIPAFQGSSRTPILKTCSSNIWRATTPGMPGTRRRAPVRPRLILTMCAGTMPAEPILSSATSTDPKT